MAAKRRTDAIAKRLMFMAAVSSHNLPAMADDSSSIGRAWKFVRANSLLMVTGALIALIWANLSPEGYERFTHPLHFAVNDVAMAFFFGLAMKEIIEATAPGGPLYSLRRAAVPVIAAVGGMAGPALLYVGMAAATGRP